MEFEINIYKNFVRKECLLNIYIIFIWGGLIRTFASDCPKKIETASKREIRKANIRIRRTVEGARRGGGGDRSRDRLRYRVIFCPPSRPNRNYVCRRPRSLGNPHHIAIQPLLRQQRTRGNPSVCPSWRCLPKSLNPVPD